MFKYLYLPMTMSRVDERETRRDASYDGPGRRNGSEDGDMPMWVRVLWRAGVTGTIALILVWFGAQTLPRLLTEVVSLTAAVNANTLELKAIRTVLDEHGRLLYKIQFCTANFAESKERQQCFDR